MGFYTTGTGVWQEEQMAALGGGRRLSCPLGMWARAQVVGAQGEKLCWWQCRVVQGMGMGCRRKVGRLGK